MRRWLPFLLLILLLQGIPAADTIAKVAGAADTTVAKVVQHLKADRGKLQQRKFDAERLRSYRNNQDFRYDEGIVEVNSLWERFWSWIWRLISNMLQSAAGKGSLELLKYVGLGLLVLLMGFVISRLAGLDLKIFSAKSRSVEVPYTEMADNIHEIDFSTELEKAVSAGNFRLAVRLFYLQSLKRLSDRHLIEWQPEKTNQAYVRELSDPQRKDEFQQLTRQFEYIWYGEFFIDRERFAEVKNAFETFNRGVS